VTPGLPEYFDISLFIPLVCVVEIDFSTAPPPT
jgi:hypothetical protein